MTIYTVHIPPATPDVSAAAEGARFTPDGFSLMALLLPLPWLLWNRLWLASLGYGAMLLGIEALAMVAGPVAAGILALLFGLWFALEARSILRWTLERRGWQLAAVVEGDSLEMAEERFVRHLVRTGLPSPVSAPRQGPGAPPAPAGPVVGLFPVAGGR